MAAIFIVSSLPEAPLPTSVTDKSAHWLAYAALGVLVIRALGGGLPAQVTIRVALLALLITIGYGITDEIHQAFVPGRVADVADLYADAAGAAAATVACWAWDIIRTRSTPATGASHDGL
jgi:VanZ family protein